MPAFLVNKLLNLINESYTVINDKKPESINNNTIIIINNTSENDNTYNIMVGNPETPNSDATAVNLVQSTFPTLMLVL